MTDAPKKHPGGHPLWKKGESGNPAGKSKGSRNRVSRAIDALLDGQAEALTQRCISAALAGDMVAMRLCLERIAPPRREAPVKIGGMPKVTDANSAIEALSRLIEAASAGEAAPGEAAQLGGLVVNYLGISAIQVFAERLAALENARELKVIDDDSHPHTARVPAQNFGNGSEPPAEQ